MLVKDAMSTKVETVAPNTTLQECARMMRRMDIGALPVWENGKLIGMVTDRDVCCRSVGDGRDPAAMTVREAMSSDVTSCFEDEDCIDAARLMQSKRLRRLAVLNRQKSMVGLLSVDDIARYSHDLAGEILEAASPWPH
ncbi:MAG TPA: CBS domain-containing protein [Gammaproteobacteria bacterium]|jgi:CBS domain-containing protein